MWSKGSIISMPLNTEFFLFSRGGGSRHHPSAENWRRHDSCAQGDRELQRRPCFRGYLSASGNYPIHLHGGQHRLGDEQVKSDHLTANVLLTQALHPFYYNLRVPVQSSRMIRVKCDIPTKIKVKVDPEKKPGEEAPPKYGTNRVTSKARHNKLSRKVSLAT